jgi:multiple sugar transport system permease protein
MMKRISGPIVILYAVLSMLPLAWIFLTGLKSPPDSIAYPPKVLFHPSVEGYCNLFLTKSRQTEEYIAHG